jgi:predicted site-specific integrase-resolvase
VGLIEELAKRKELMDVSEVATLLGIHRISLDRWTYAGTIPCLKFDGRKKFDPHALAVWIRQRKLVV